MWNAFYNVISKSGEKIEAVSKPSVQISASQLTPYATFASDSNNQNDG
jgi:hypothetical protein